MPTDLFKNLKIASFVNRNTFSILGAKSKNIKKISYLIIKNVIITKNQFQNKFVQKAPVPK